MRILISSLIDFVVAIKRKHAEKFLTINFHDKNINESNVIIPTAYFLGLCDFYENGVSPGYFCNNNKLNCVSYTKNGNIFNFNIRSVYELIDVKLRIEYCKGNDSSFFTLEQVDYYQFPDRKDVKTPHAVKVRSLNKIEMELIDEIWNREWKYTFQMKTKIDDVLKLF